MKSVPSAQEIAVLLALPPLLADLAEEILNRDPETRVVGRLDAHGALSPESAVAAARDAHAAVVLLGVPGRWAARFCEALMDRQPRIKVLLIDEDGREATAAELAPRVTPLGEMWPERLIDAIREANGRTWNGAWSR
jgi:DNA-binding NarL/FixJ family response regulator